MKRKKWILRLLMFVVCLNLTILTAFGQSQMIIGTVTFPDGDGIPGVTIVEKSTINGTITNSSGEYALEVSSSDAILVFSFVGFKTQEILAGGQTQINVVLEEDILGLDEVVVIGYGTVKKSDLTGSVATVKVSAIKDIPANSVDGLLQGRSAGLQVINSSQDPGASSTIRIRGGSSLRGSNSPLVVVDGFPLGEAGNLKQINPADILSMEILKDASASAIYGSRGANGVIMITTKKAKAGTTTVSVKQQTTISDFTSKLDLWRNPVLMAQLNNESRINGGFPALYIGAKSTTGVYYPSVSELSSGKWPHNTRWDDLVFCDNPVSNSTTISVMSSNDKTSFNLSGNYYSDMGVYIKDNYDKYGYHLSVDHQIFDNFKIRFSNILSKGKRNSNGGLSYWRNPVFPVYNEDGSYYLTGTNDYGHPIAISDKRKNKTKTKDVLTSIALEWQVHPNLKLTSQLNYKYGSSINDVYNPKTYTEGGDFNNGAAYIYNWTGENIVSETFANYSKKFGNHDIGLMMGFSYEYYTSRSSDMGAFDFVNETLGNENMGAGNPEKNQVSNGYSESNLVSGMFRLNYSFLDRYLLTVTARQDGSSKFGENNHWALFPSGAISWKAHKEDFIQQMNVFDQLKFRLSYGISGNQGISSYQTLSRYGVSNYYNNGSWVTAIGPGYEVGRTGQDGIEVLWGGIPNPDLKWETTAQLDFGADMSFLGNRLRVIFDYYNKETSDLLRERILTPSSGYDRMWVNDGKIRNEGIELTIDGDIIRTNDWKFGGSLIFSRNQNKVLSLGNSVESGLNTDSNTGMQFEYWGTSLESFRQYPNILAIGKPVNVFYGYKTEGIVQTLEEGIGAGLDGDYAEPGEFKYVDLNEDGVIDTNDQTIIGDPNPDFMMSLSLDLTYKKFDFSVFFNGVFGSDILNTQAFNQPSNTPLRWTLDNPTNNYPSLRDGRSVKLSDWWIEKGSFVRIQNLTVGYTFDLLKSKTKSSVRFYLNASNLYTFTNFDGYDPEVGTDGIYWGGYPRLRKWTFGLDLIF